MAPKPIHLYGLGPSMAPKPINLQSLGAIDGPKPYKFKRFGAIEGPKPYKASTQKQKRSEIRPSDPVHSSFGPAARVATLGQEG